LFEALAAVSATLGLAIPVFMEKVMRPRYEERFDEYRKTNRETFIEELDDAVTKLKQTKESMTPEIVETMESLFSDWGQVKTNESKLDMLLGRRKYLFVGWMLSLILSLFSTEYAEYVLTGQTTLRQITILVFVLMFFVSCWYVIDLFILDEKLSKFRKPSITEQVRAPTVEEYRASMKISRELEAKVENTLIKFHIPFEKEPLYSRKGYFATADFVVPSSKNPKYFIEVKRHLISRRQLDVVSNIANRLKAGFTGSKTILVTDTLSTPSSLLRIAKEAWDFVIDFTELERIRNIIKL